jgi:hypothetical protein
VNFIENYLFDAGVELEVPVIVWPGMRLKTVYSSRVNIAGPEVGEVNDLLAALTLVEHLSLTRTARPLPERRVPGT